MIRKDEFSHQLSKLVFPIAFQQLLLSLVSACDAFMLVRLSQSAMSAVSLAGQITFVHNLFLTAMIIGLSMFASQFCGKRDKESTEKIFAYVLVVTSAVSLIFSLLAFFCPRLLMAIFTDDKNLISKGAKYLRVVSPSFLLTGISQCYLCLLKNTKRAVQSSLIGLFSVVCNIILNALLIFGLFGFTPLGISGAALATVIARLFEVLFAVLLTMKKGSERLRARFIIHSDKALSSRFWVHTFPVLGNETVWGIGFTMYSVIMGHMGTDAVAASSAANIIKNLAACFCAGLGSGGGIMVGNELGAGRFDTAKNYGGRLCRLSVITGAISGGVILCLSPLIVGISGLDETAAKYLWQMLIICSYYMVGRAINTTTIAGIFCAGGDTKFGFVCDAVTMWCFTVPLGLIAAFILKLPVIAVYFIISLDEIVKLPEVYKNYKKYKWIKDITGKEELL